MMEKSKTRRALLLALLVCFSSLPMVAAPQAGPQTVVDFYLALPKEYVYDVDRKHREELLDEGRGRIIVKDIKNGFLAISGDAGDPGIIMALFKRTDGSYLVGVHPYNELTDDFYFLLLEGKQWRNVSTSVIPEYSKRLHYELPRYGTTIEVSNESGEKLYDLVWNKSKFNKK